MPYTFAQRLAAHAAGSFSRVFFNLTLRHVRHECRWHIHGPLDEALRSGQQVIIAGWHQDVLPFFHYLCNFSALEQKRRFVMLASRSFDGELTEQTLSPMGFEFVRGSAGRAGSRAALRQMRRALAGGRDVVVIADGPRPPAYEMRAGPAYLSRKTGVPLFVARGWGRPQLVLSRTWFRMVVPLPRCDFALFSSGPVPMHGTLEESRLRAQNALLELNEQADAHLYLRPKVTGGRALAWRGVDLHAQRV